MSKTCVQVVCAAIEQEGRYLITQRKAAAVFPLLWEFPGGRVQQGESDEQALLRELHYRLGIEATIADKISTTYKSYSAFDVQLTLYQVHLGSVAATPVRVHDLAWVAHENLSRYAFVPTDEQAIKSLLKLP